MHEKAIEYELLINLCLFSKKKKANGKKKNPTMKEEFKLLLIQCCWQCQVVLKTLVFFP